MASMPKGPFPAEVLAEPEIVYDDNDPDVLYPPGATAQNNYAPPKLYQCRYCGSVVNEYELEHHVCPEEDPEDG
jgi:5-methylcytosine-specific restriction endonuclease McrA